MRFLLSQIIIVILVCIFIAALSNLSELGAAGWIIAGVTGHGLYRIYRHMHYSFKSSDSRTQWAKFNSEASDFSRQLREFMLDDATEATDE